jgi:hypothetical protein
MRRGGDATESPYTLASEVGVRARRWQVKYALIAAAAVIVGLFFYNAILGVIGLFVGRDHVAGAG